ncbi:fibrohexamerin-like [Aricia agestis]|uniref:fibrohexamerin-like n=1 Tax=Aricia agestis TaxID=91739 RepID=UPI001C2028A2|nr:fibrohexamerin-like [Aricia agestis]
MTRVLILFLVAGVCYGAAPGIVRPCHFNNLKCIADNLQANSLCDRNVPGLPSEYVIPRFEFHTPFFNSTYVEKDLHIRNHDKCRISEFFFNVKSDTAVLAIDCPQLGFKSNRTLIQHRSLQEDTSYSYNIDGIYPLIRITVSIRNADQLDVCSSTAFAEVTALPTFNINPNDMKTANFLTRDLTLLNIYEIETFFWRANQLARYYINLVLCDFGCNY